LRSAGVVIIGGGVIGASVAYHLAARGCRDVLVLERGDGPGAGSTGRATGGFRAQFGTRVNVQLSLLSRDKLLRFREEHGVDPCFRQCGYLFLAPGRAHLEALRAALAVQRECGLAEAREVGPEEAALINPAVDFEGVVGGSFCPSDGFMRPLEILRGYAASAARLGVRFEHGAGVEGFRRGAGGRLESVVTAGGEIGCGAVVNAAGAWAAEVTRMAGAEVPVRPLRRQVAVTAPCDLLPEEMPMTVFTDDGFHLRVRDGRILLLWPDDPPGPDPFDVTNDEAWLAAVTAKARRRLPGLCAAEIDRAACWAGLYEMTPDGHALLGRVPGVENLYLANGSSGHGVMHAPALGHLLAEVVLDGAALSLDARPLRPERFEEGDPNPRLEFI